MKSFHDILVVGAGPAGLSAAISAAEAGASVLVLEKMDHPGLKLLATGGGHCNITNTADEEAFIRAFGRQGRFILPALKGTSPEKLRLLMERLGVRISSTDGFHFFPESGKAGDVLDALLRKCSSLGVAIQKGHPVDDLIVESGRVAGARCDDSSYSCKAVVLATGGKSYPRLGSTGDGYRIAEALGHAIATPLPSLADIRVSEKWPGLCAGISLEDAAITLKASGTARTSRGALLFTHHGISGPAALNISGDVSGALLKRGEVALELDLSPQISMAEWAAKFAEWQQCEGARNISTLLSPYLPKNLALRLAEHHGIALDVKAAAFPKNGREALAGILKETRLNAVGTGGFDSAMVTRGGVSLKHVAPGTLASKLVEGLFFAGEILDLDGPCGGYNLQWAFSSGTLAGASAAAQVEKQG